jgi:hypothetical protein
LVGDYASPSRREEEALEGCTQIRAEIGVHDEYVGFRWRIRTNDVWEEYMEIACLIQ